jgi:hypothetical protein
MHESANRERDSVASQRLCDRMHAILATTFTPARLLLSWADPPTVVPGFQVGSTGTAVVVRYVQARDGALSMRRAHARALIEQYRLALLAAGWQVDLVDAPSKMPYLCCCRTNDVMSN